MTNLKQKNKEQFHFDLFKELYKQLPDGEEHHQCGQKPDFLIRHSSGILGIEHTEVFKNKSPNQACLPQKQEGSLRKIVDDARIICEEKGIPPFYVNVWFDTSIKHTQMKKPEAEKISQSLAELIESWYKETSNSSDVLNPQSKLPEIFRINITRGGVNGQHYWTKEGPGWVKPDFIDEL